ncbi:hypothetical protein D3C71_418580 [compost metagenome]
MTSDLKNRILRHENDRRHADALERGLSVSIVSQTLLSQRDSEQIAREGQNAADAIAGRIAAETGGDPAISVRYLNPNHDIHDRLWMGM